jgi:hypothetical protein
MPYQYKREPLNNGEANKLINACNYKKKQGMVFCFFSKRDFKLFIGDFWMKGWLFCIPQSQAWILM